MSAIAEFLVIILVPSILRGELLNETFTLRHETLLLQQQIVGEMVVNSGVIDQGTSHSKAVVLFMFMLLFVNINFKHLL